LEQHGLTLAEFSDETRERLRDEVIPEYGNVSNPLDVLGDANADRYEAALSMLQEDENIDGMLVIPLLQPLPLNSEVIDAIVNVAEDYDKPLVTAMTGGEFTGLHMQNLEKNGVAAYAAPERAADALYSLHRYGQWLQRDQ